MKITVFKNITREYPEDQVVCLNSFDADDLLHLAADIRQITRQNPFLLSAAGYVTHSDAEIMLTLDQKDTGFTVAGPSGSFECRLSAAGYAAMAGIVDSFITPTGVKSGFGWLYDLDGPIDFLISCSAKW